MKKILICASLIALSTSAFAAEGMYLRADLGMAKPTFKKKGSTQTVDSKFKPMYNVGVGYKFNDNFRSDVNLQLSNSKSSFVKGKSTVGVVNSYYDFKNDSIFTPYVTAGVGIAKHTSKTSTSKLKSPTNFAWNAGLGSKINMTSNIDLDVSYKYASLGKILKTAKTKAHAHQVAAGVIFNM